jgi:hypothetical protein
MVAIQNQWFPLKSATAMKFNDRFTCCYGKLMSALEVSGCYGKQTVVMGVIGCYGKSDVAVVKSMVAMKLLTIMGSHRLLWKSMVAVERVCLLWKSMKSEVAMGVNVCCVKLMVAI